MSASFLLAEAVHATIAHSIYLSSPTVACKLACMHTPECTDEHRWTSVFDAMVQRRTAQVLETPTDSHLKSSQSCSTCASSTTRRVTVQSVPNESRFWMHLLGRGCVHQFRFLLAADDLRHKPLSQIYRCFQVCPLALSASPARAHNDRYAAATQRCSLDHYNTTTITMLRLRHLMAGSKRSRKSMPHTISYVGKSTTRNVCDQRIPCTHTVHFHKQVLYNAYDGQRRPIS